MEGEIIHSNNKHLPNHVAIVTSGKSIWANKNGKKIDYAYRKSFEIIESIINEQVSLKIPIISFFLLSNDLKSQEQFSILIDNMTQFFDNLAVSKFMLDNKIKVSILGRWYDLPGRLVESIKQIIDKSKNNDGYFVNFCLNYDGQEELLDAIKLLARQIKSDKVDPDSITKEMIKGNLSSSYFSSPDLIIINGDRNETTGIFLWDSGHSQLYVTNKLFPDFTKEEFSNAIKNYNIKKT